MIGRVEGDSLRVSLDGEERVALELARLRAAHGALAELFA